MERERPESAKLVLRCYDCSFTFTVNTDGSYIGVEGAGRFLDDVSDGHEEMTGHETYLEVYYEGKRM